MSGSLFEKLFGNKANNFYKGNSYKYAIDAGFEGDDEAVVEQLKATGVTRKDILVTDLMHLLNMRGMLVHMAKPNAEGSKWTGSIPVMLAAVEGAGNPEYTMATKVWFSHITNPRSVKWETTNPEYSAPFWALSQMFSESGIFNEGDFEAIAELGGGWIFSNLDVTKYLEDKQYYIDTENSIMFDNRITAFINRFRNLITPQSDPESVFAQAWTDTDPNPPEPEPEGGPEDPEGDPEDP